MPSAYPALSDIQAYLADQGADVPAAAQAHLDAAIEEWERLTGYVPFLAEGSDSTNFYDPASMYEIFDLGTGYHTITSIAIGVTNADPIGTVLTEGDDYVLVPYNRNGRPIEGVRFFSFTIGSRPRSVKIVGRRGYSDNIPDDAWRAILIRAAIFAKQGGKYAGVASFREGDIQVAYGDASVVPEEVRTWRETVLRYTRIPVGDFNGEANL